MDKLRQLWQMAFGDTEPYMDFYFAEKAKKSKIFADYEKEELVSMAFFTPYDGHFFGEAKTVEYIVGVATAEKYRHQHRMTSLLKRAIANRKREGIEVIFLSPENPAVYQSLGFLPVYQRMTTKVQGPGAPILKTCPWGQLKEEDKRRVGAWAEKRLAGEAFDFYLKRSVMYYDECEKELQALDGDLLTLWHGGELAAIGHVIREERIPEVTELIIGPGYSCAVLETLLSYLSAGAVQISDSYFLMKEEKAVFFDKKFSCEKKSQEKPMIMYRYTDERKVRPLSCYINDIT